jgi:hypothetical protein
MKYFPQDKQSISSDFKSKKMVAECNSKEEKALKSKDLNQM